MARYTMQQLESLWVQAGGNPKYASMAAAIALAESGGDPNSTGYPKNGTVDRGLWQINSIHGSQSTLDPLANARAAVAISGNGSTWRPWCVAWSDGKCGGTYLGDSAPVNKYITSKTSTGSTPASVGSLVNQGFPATTNVVDPTGVGGAISNAVDTVSLWVWFGFWGVIAGALVVGGALLLFMQTRAGGTAVGVAKRFI